MPATENRLRVDLTIDCESSEHQAYMAYSTVMLVLYPISVPLTAMFRLYYKEIKDFLIGLVIS